MTLNFVFGFQNILKYSYSNRIVALISSASVNEYQNLKRYSNTSCSKVIESEEKNDNNIVTYKLESDKFPYYVENGLRKVYPYYFRHSAYCKGRWLNQNIIDLYCKEFAVYPREEYERRLQQGLLRVNGKIIPLNYVLKNADYITAIVHKHELGVLAAPIRILFEDDNLLVIDKPPSLPVHPCGLYRFNSITKILSIEHNYDDLHVIHRLDRLTSGVLIFAKNSEKSREMHDLMNVRNVKKEYICRVEGNFPDETVTCNKSIKQFHNTVGVSLVHPEGKTCITEFQKLSFNGKSSVVLCKPFTGRTHQIRVHLQYLGYPIVNDPLYNNYVFGNLKGKHGLINKPISQLLEDLNKEYADLWWTDKPSNQETYHEIHSDLMDAVTLTYCNHFKEFINKEIYKKDIARIGYDAQCFYCESVRREPKQTHLLMLLHALKYESDDWQFKTDIPLWASSDWTVS